MDYEKLWKDMEAFLKDEITKTDEIAYMCQNKHSKELMEKECNTLRYVFAKMSWNYLNMMDEQEKSK